MKRVRRQFIYFLGLWLCLLVPAAQAQDTPARIFITGHDVGSPPSVELHAYGFDEAGSPLNFATETLTVQHDGTTISEVMASGQIEVGTFTLFLIDIPKGISSHFPAIQEAITEFAQSPTMKEQVDGVAIYKVGETAAVEMLPPDSFYNTVRNFFTVPLESEAGATALVDSLVGLIGEVDALKPRPEMVASIVVISDGTDAVSSRFQPEDVPGQAVSQGVPIHTIWVENSNLSAESQQVGQDYLAETAAASWGLTASLDDAAGVAAIWQRIARFREQTRVQYVADELSGGAFPVSLSVADRPATQAQTMVEVPPNLPSVVLSLPPESRQLSLPDLEEPVTLNFSADLRWLDGETRSLEAAQLQVNGAVVPNLSIEDVSQFTADIPNLVYGANPIQLVVLDDQGLRVSSPTVVLMVSEGEMQIPSELEADDGFGRLLGRIFLLMIVIALLGGAVFAAWRSGWFSLAPISFRLPKGPRGKRRSAAAEAETAVSPPHTAGSTYERAYLIVLESVSAMPREIGLGMAEVRIGRSPTQCNIPFENDITVSRLHATLMLEGNQYRIYDAGSTSGTWVNDRQVPEYGIQLIDGDEIFLGAVHLRYRQV